MVDDVCTLIELHLRFHGYGEGWTDSAVRRYVRDAGPLLDRLNQLTRADCTTRNEPKAERARRSRTSSRSGSPASPRRRTWTRCARRSTGTQVMEHLGIPPGPLVGEALAYLMELRMERGPIPEDEAFALLDAWAAEREP